MSFTIVLHRYIFQIFQMLLIISPRRVSHIWKENNALNIQCQKRRIFFNRCDIFIYPAKNSKINFQIFLKYGWGGRYLNLLNNNYAYYFGMDFIIYQERRSFCKSSRNCVQFSIHRSSSWFIETHEELWKMNRPFEGSEFFGRYF